jgi:molybdopterin/thiamine biosynthesis adenylyltransferase
MLSERERERYRRQIMLFGDEGQERLKKAHIFIAGAGGLGSPVSLYLAVAGIDTRIDESNAAQLIGNADGIVDAMDNYPTRYLLNTIAIRNTIPLFHGAIRGFYGQATTIIPGKTPCLKCIFPKAPPQEVFPVVGATPGVIGTVQATEVIKYLLQSGDLLTNRLFVWDGLAGRADEIHAERMPCCPACGGLTPDKGGKKK